MKGPILLPLGTLLHSRKFLIFLGTVAAIITVHFVPALAGSVNELTGSFTVLAGVLIGGIAAEDVVKNPIKPEEIDQAIADALNDFIQEITPDAIKELVPRLTEEEVQRIIALLTKNAPTTA